MPLILGVRFVFGLRTVLPFALGMGKITTLRFQLLNLAGAIFWSVAVGGGGYLFGRILEQALGNLRRYEEILFAVLAVGGFLYWLYTRRRRTENRGQSPILSGRLSDDHRTLSPARLATLHQRIQAEVADLPLRRH